MDGWKNKRPVSRNLKGSLQNGRYLNLKSILEKENWSGLH